jgi:hypothetical protein
MIIRRPYWVVVEPLSQEFDGREPLTHLPPGNRTWAATSGRQRRRCRATIRAMTQFTNTRRPLDPRRVNIGLDANALDRDGSNHDRLVDRFCALSDAGVLRVVTPGGVRDEVNHPRTPDDVQAATLPQIFNLRPEPNEQQRAARRRVHQILQGKARPGKHAADASHLSEATEGCGYFITHDGRILKKRDELHAALPPSLNIVTLEEFFHVLDAYETGQLI